jgi:hypothetical protein
VKLAVFAGILAGVGYLARRGALPLTGPIVAGDWAFQNSAGK